MKQSMVSYILGTSHLHVVNSILHRHDATLCKLKEIWQNQYHMKQYVDQHRSKCLFEEGYHTFIFIQPYKKTSLKTKMHQNLAPNFYNPYQIIQSIFQVAYKLALPTQSNILQVFHLSCLKKVVGHYYRVQTKLPKIDEEESIWLQLEEFLYTRQCHLCQCTIYEYLIQWKDTSPKYATWEPSTMFQQFPQCQHWGAFLPLNRESMLEPYANPSHLLMYKDISPIK